MRIIIITFFFQSLGNHEFDETVDGLIPFIHNVTTPVLAANLILGKVPKLQSEKNLRKSIVIEKNNVKIGIIGYLTPETKILTPKTDVEYEDEIIAINREVKKLKQQNVTIFIALGHSGFIRDVKIAKEVEDLDVVIGGHSNTFLLNTNTSEIPEVPEGPYPTEVKQANGRIVRVVQAYAYTKYMGQLHLVFDASGEVIKCNGTPLLLDHSIPKDPEVLKIVNKYRSEIDSVNNVAVGSSLVFLNERDCRLWECNIGDVITDAVLNYTKVKYANKYPDVTISIIQSGRIRASINHDGMPFNMTRGDWVTVLPFSDTLTILTMNGTVLREALEHSVSAWRRIDCSGQFIQFSGMRVTFDLAQPIGARVVKAEAVCSECGGKMEDIHDKYLYQVIMPTFIADGGDGYETFPKLPREKIVDNEVDGMLYYLKLYSPINPQIDGRIKIMNEDNVNFNVAKTHYNSLGVSLYKGSILFYMFVLLISNHFLM